MLFLLQWVPAAKNFTVDDIDRVFSDDESVLNVADVSGGISVARTTHF
ncbi:MAG TPA: hypothetical protein VGM64_01060 [Lacunisphaera sp.]